MLYQASQQNLMEEMQNLLPFFLMSVYSASTGQPLISPELAKPDKNGPGYLAFPSIRLVDNDERTSLSSAFKLR